MKDLQQPVIVPYIGTALPTGATTEVLFSTVVSFPGAKWCAISRLSRLLVNLVNSQSGTAKGYRSSDRGVNWTQVYDSGALAAPAARASNTLDLHISEFPDFKLEWLNGGVTQTVFVIDMALLPEQVKVT